jgi:hypothetical protein
MSDIKITEPIMINRNKKVLLISFSLLSYLAYKLSIYSYTHLDLDGNVGINLLLIFLLILLFSALVDLIRRFFTTDNIVTIDETGIETKDYNPMSWEQINHVKFIMRNERFPILLIYLKDPAYHMFSIRDNQIKIMESYNEKYGTPFYVFLVNSNYKNTNLNPFLSEHFSQLNNV